MRGAQFLEAGVRILQEIDPSDGSDISSARLAGIDVTSYDLQGPARTPVGPPHRLPGTNNITSWLIVAGLQSAPHETGNGEGDRASGGGAQLERELACYLLELTYDASPLVRAEVALGLARVSLSHPLLFQVR